MNLTQTSAKPWPSVPRQIVALVGFTLLCFAAAGIGTMWTNASLANWYRDLAKPPWNPPNWVFGPVWSALYLMMAVAAWLVWRREASQHRWHTWVPFGAQLALNTLWSGIFFGLRQPGWALGEMIFLWLAIVATIYAFGKISRPAAGLLVPYLAWVSFAAVLNFELWRLNA